VLNYTIIQHIRPNCCLILGHFGFPALGVKGAAIATLIARFIEMVFIISFTYLKRLPAVRWRDFFSVPTGLIKTFLIIWIRIFNIINLAGVFRGGGDTKYSLYMEVLSMWGVGVPLAFMGGFFWKLPVHWVFALINLEEVFKMIMSIYRLYSKKWIHNLVGGTMPPKAMKYEKGKDCNPI